MPYARKSRFTLILLLVLFSCTIAAVKATSENFSLPAGQTTVRIVDLNAEDYVSGRVTIVGGNITFMIYGPGGDAVSPITTVAASNFEFKATEAGTYSFVFDNSQSTDDKNVSLNYDVKHYWFGMPQEFVLMLIIVFLGVLGLVIYALVTKR